MLRAVFMLMLLLPIAACGWAEWPPPGAEQPTVVRAADPKPPAAQQSAHAPDAAPAVPTVSVQTAALPSVVRQPGSTAGTPGAMHPNKEHVISHGETLYSV